MIKPLESSLNANTIEMAIPIDLLGVTDTSLKPLMMQSIHQMICLLSNRKLMMFSKDMLVSTSTRELWAQCTSSIRSSDSEDASLWKKVFFIKVKKLKVLRNQRESKQEVGIQSMWLLSHLKRKRLDTELLLMFSWKWLAQILLTEISKLLEIFQDQ